MRLIHAGWALETTSNEVIVINPCLMHLQTARPSALQHKHPVVLNAERLAVLPRRKGEWSDYDTRKLINLANTLAASVPSKAVLYQKLASHFVGRSAEGVKKRLIKANWCGIDKHGFLWSSDEETIVNVSSDSNMTVIDVEQLEEERWRGGMIDAIINSLTKVNEPKIRSKDLLAIARSMKFGRATDDEARNKLEAIMADCFPVRWRFQPRKTAVFRKSQSNRMIRRMNYAALQKLYHTRRKDAASSALDGSWARAYKREVILPINMKEFWTEIFEVESLQDPRHVVGDKQEWNVLAAVSSAEIRKALRDAAGTAAGVDKFQTTDLLKWNLEAVAQLLNLLLVLELPTSQLSMARLTFVPKVEEPVTPADYRPIAVSSVLQRALHKILARRVRDTVKFSALQVAFQKKDGCVEASTILHAVLRSVHDEVKAHSDGFS
ncbi:hypothetical protein AHF37_12136 [Paragonimus kellicotti]|nr:hypothetical protein AHF37_12136 [Paragonimus kellicotti]